MTQRIMLNLYITSLVSTATSVSPLSLSTPRSTPTIWPVTTVKVIVGRADTVIF